MTELDICNIALLRLGSEPISSLTERTAEARIAKANYPLVRDNLLAAHAWGFASTSAEMSSNQSDDNNSFDYVFTLGPNVVRVLSVLPASGGKLKGGYSINGRRLLCNYQKIILNYVQRVSEGNFPAHFIEALVSYLAMSFSLPLADRSIYASLRSDSAGALKNAKLIDRQDTQQTQLLGDTLVSVRR